MTTSPVYTNATVTQIYPQLRDVWAAEIEKSDYKGRLDAMQGLSKMTLDVIGQAGTFYSPLLDYDLRFWSRFQLRLRCTESRRTSQ